MMPSRAPRATQLATSLFNRILAPEIPLFFDDAGPTRSTQLLRAELMLCAVLGPSPRLQPQGLYAAGLPLTISTTYDGIHPPLELAIPRRR